LKIVEFQNDLITGLHMNNIELIIVF